MTVSFCPEPLTLSFLFSGMLNLVIRLSADLEMQMNAMARVEYYKSIETESYDGEFLSKTSYFKLFVLWNVELGDSYVC